MYKAQVTDNLGAGSGMKPDEKAIDRTILLLHEHMWPVGLIAKALEVSEEHVAEVLDKAKRRINARS